MRTPKPVVLDTDPGLDDALALMLALRSPVIEVVAVTVVAGNVPLAACIANALRLLQALAPEDAPPVFEGCAEPLSPTVARAEHVHGGDGMGGVAHAYPLGERQPEGPHAADALIDLARRHREELTVIAVGPLTNVATALQRDADAMAGIGELVVMGGSADAGGNVTPRAEFNFYSDPAAARAVLRSGLRTTVVGLDATHRAPLARRRFDERLRTMPDGTPRKLLADIANPYFNFAEGQQGSEGCYLHDPLAVAAVIDPEVIQTVPMECDVIDSQGLTRGAMVVNRDGAAARASSVRVAMGVDAERFHGLFLDTVCGS